MTLCENVADRLLVGGELVLPLKSAVVDSSTMYVAFGSVTAVHDTVY